MIDTSREWILCAAIWYKDGTEAPRGFIAQNISSGVVIGQWRHGNVINVRATNKLWNKYALNEYDKEPCVLTSNPVSKEDIENFEIENFETVDGFLTSKGRFVDRWQGMQIAYEAGQVDEEHAKKKDYNGEKYTTEEFQNQEPHYRHTKIDGNGWNMMYSEDLY